MLFTRKFFEALRRPENLLATRKLQGSTGAGRLHQNLLPNSHRANPTYPRKLEELKAQYCHQMEIKLIILKVKFN